MSSSQWPTYVFICLHFFFEIHNWVFVFYCGNSSYGHDKCDAKQKREFINLPSILTIQLMRFQFNSETEVADKNNKRFEFGPNLDLSEYSAGSEYLLHSVLGKFIIVSHLFSKNFIRFVCIVLQSSSFGYYEWRSLYCIRESKVLRSLV